MLPEEGHPGVYTLSLRQRAEPRFAIADTRYPVLSLIKYLRDRGWAERHGLVTHEDIGIMQPHGLKTRPKHDFVEAQFEAFLGCFARRQVPGLGATV